MTTQFMDKHSERFKSLKEGESACIGNNLSAHEVRRRNGGLEYRTIYRYGKPTEWKSFKY